MAELKSEQPSIRAQSDLEDIENDRSCEDSEVHVSIEK